MSAETPEYNRIAIEIVDFIRDVERRYGYNQDEMIDGVMGAVTAYISFNRGPAAAIVSLLETAIQLTRGTERLN